jgi:ribonuclease HII
MITVGIDEVGRGCWAGPLVAGAVILPQPLPGLKDSKQLSRAQREKLAKQIEAEGEVGLGWVSAAEVDALGLTEAVRTAMERALEQITTDYDEVIIDGGYNFFPDEPRARAVIKADATVSAVSAASIVAKVARDRYMSELGPAYAVYEFAKHVGYGTALHLARLKEHGVSDEHRKSYKPIRELAV